MAQTELVERLVRSDGYSLVYPVPGKPGEFQTYLARHGERIQVTPEEAARGEAIGGLVDETKAAAAADERAELLARVAELEAQLATARGDVAPVVIGPPPAPPAGVTLTPSITGEPQRTPLPDDVGPIGPTSAAQVAAAMAATDGAPVVSVTPRGEHVTAEAGNIGDVNPTLARPPRQPGDAVDDAELEAMTAPEVIAYLNQHSDDPDEVDRVDELEAGRARGVRKTVTDAIDAIRERAADAGE